MTSQQLKKWISLLLVTLLLVGQLPLWADAPASKTESKPEFDLWALSELNEAEKYGIYTTEWYKEGFKKPITFDKYQQLLQALSAKLKETGVSPKASATPFTASKNAKHFTRQEVMNSIFSEIGRYDTSLLVKGESMPSLLQKIGVLKGQQDAKSLKKPCTVQEAVLMAARAVQYVNTLHKTNAKGLMWQVKKGDTTLILLGSVHMANHGIYPFDPSMVAAYDKADALYVEANILNPTAGYDQFLNAAKFAEGTQLKDKIDKALYAKLQEVCKLYQIPEANLTSFKPWMVALSLSNVVTTATDSLTGANKNAALGIDVYFLARTLLDKKPVVELEGLAFQGQLFDSLSDDFEAKYLSSVLDQLLALASKDVNNKDVQAIKAQAQKTQEQFKAWLTLWKQGDKAGFKSASAEAFSTSSESIDNELTALLLGKRDQAMAEKLAALLEKGEKKTYFVVVGAAHLITDKMVVDILKSKGYTVEEFYK